MRAIYIIILALCVALLCLCVYSLKGWRVMEGSIKSLARVINMDRTPYECNCDIIQTKTRTVAPKSGSMKPSDISAIATHARVDKSGVRIPVTPIDLNLGMSEEEFEDKLFQYYEYISYKCNHRERMGNKGDGGWDVCLDPPYNLTAPCLVYSFGINNEWSFDDDISKRRGCQVHSFDPSMKQKNYQRSKLISFYQTGIGAKDEVNGRKWVIRTLSTLKIQLKHTNSTIDMLKMDIEGDEFPSLSQMLVSDELRYVKQLALELHLSGWKATTVRGYRLLRHLELAGFRKYHYHPNGACRYKVTKIPRIFCHELYYININFLK